MIVTNFGTSRVTYSRTRPLPQKWLLAPFPPPLFPPGHPGPFSCDPRILKHHRGLHGQSTQENRPDRDLHRHWGTSDRGHNRGDHPEIDWNQSCLFHGRRRNRPPSHGPGHAPCNTQPHKTDAGRGNGNGGEGRCGHRSPRNPPAGRTRGHQHGHHCHEPGKRLGSLHRHHFHRPDRLLHPLGHAAPCASDRHGHGDTGTQYRQPDPGTPPRRLFH